MRFSVVFALTGVGLGVLVQLLPTWFALRFGVSEDEVGLWIGLANAASIIAIPLIPRLVRRRGMLVSSAISGIGATAFLAVMPLAGSFEGAAGLFVMRSVLEAMGWAMLLSYTMGVVEEGERATTTAIAFTAWGVGATVGTFVGGELLGAGLLYVPFVIGVVAYIAASASLPVLFEVQASGRGLTWARRARISAGTGPRINRTEEGKRAWLKERMIVATDMEVAADLAKRVDGAGRGLYALRATRQAERSGEEGGRGPRSVRAARG